VGRGASPSKILRCRELADAGRLADARAECEQTLATTPTADGFALLGVIHQAAGNLDAAADAFRKALYLNPTHREALMHAELVSRTRGQTAAADAFRARLARVPGGES
jgi:chemotaxis protein methyltransferase WspC